LDGLVNWDGVLKFGGKLDSDHVTQFWGCIKRPITRSFVLKCSYPNDTIKEGPIMWMSFALDGNRQEGKWLVIECKTLKWVKANNALPEGSPWQVPMGDGWLWHHLHDYDDYKTKDIQMHRMYEQRGWVVWCLHLLHKFFWNMILLNIELKAFAVSNKITTQSRWRYMVHLMSWIITS
jgi:hypothetical protein